MDNQPQDTETPVDLNLTDAEFLATLSEDKLKRFFVVLVDRLRTTTMQIDVVKQAMHERGIDLKAELTPTETDVKSKIYSKTETHKLADKMIKKRVVHNSMAKRAQSKNKTGN